ncbi:MAG: Ppx/GppA family phosphatase [Pseudomonadota bacterium]
MTSPMGEAAAIQNQIEAARAAGQRGPLRAVIDIGSNSVRLVIYGGPERAPAAIVNEKVLCGLGRGLRATGRLGEEPMESALGALSRYRRLLDGYGDIDVQTVATSAVRDADNSDAFLSAAADLGVPVRVLTGREEGLYAGLGVLSAEPSAEGLVGDLGGGSLELMKIGRGAPAAAIDSLVLGPLRLMGEGLRLGEPALRAHIDATLKASIEAHDLRAETLYLVGGAWRNIARVEMQLKDYPLAILHNFTMTKGDALALCRLVAGQSAGSLGKVPGVSRRRVEALPIAAVVLERLIEIAGVERLIVSAAGVREGLLFDQLSAADRAADPLFVGLGAMAERLSPDVAFAAAATEFTADLFSDETPEDRRRREAACAVCDIGAFWHPDHRGDLAYGHILRAPVTGFDHPSRVFAALAVFHRYEGRKAEPANFNEARLLDPGQRRRAMLLGLCLRFAGALAPKSAALLKKAKLTRAGDQLVLRLTNDAAALLGETPDKRLTSLADELGLEIALEID